MAGNSGYSAAELMTMQRDAAERVRQMQRRARERMALQPPGPPVREEKPEAAPVQRFLADSDRVLLLMLILLLMQEEADPALLMALVFLML